MNMENNTNIVAMSYVEGTIKSLTESGITVNGVKVDKADLGVLMALGLGTVVGVEDRPAGARGRTAKIYRIPLQQECLFSVAPSQHQDEEEAEEMY